MKKIYLLCFLLGAVVMGFDGCKKITDNTDPVSTGFIQFRMDGIMYRFYDYNSNIGDGTAVFSGNSSSHGLTISFGVSFSNKVPGQSVSLVQVSGPPLEVKNYVIPGAVGDRAGFDQVLTNLYHYTYVTGVTSGNIEITRLDTVAGGKIEGNFNFNNLYLRNQGNSAVISTNHNLTEGSFSVVLDADR